VTGRSLRVFAANVKPLRDPGSPRPSPPSRDRERRPLRPRPRRHHPPLSPPVNVHQPLSSYDVTPPPPPLQLACPHPPPVPLSPDTCPAAGAGARPGPSPPPYRSPITPAPEMILLATFGVLANSMRVGLPHLFGRTPLSLTGGDEKSAQIWWPMPCANLSGQLDRRSVVSALWDDVRLLGGSGGVRAK